MLNPEAPAQNPPSRRAWQRGRRPGRLRPDFEDDGDVLLASDEPFSHETLLRLLVGPNFGYARLGVFSISSTGQEGAESPEQREIVSARMPSSLTRSASFDRTSSRWARATSLTSAQDVRDGWASAKRARICWMLNPSSRARRMNASLRIWPSS
jgi:hypothetical protein